MVGMKFQNLLQKADEVLDPLRRGIDLRSVRGDFGESQTTTRVFHGIEHEIQENEIHVLDLVRTIFDELLCRHERSAEQGVNEFKRMSSVVVPHAKH